MSLPFARNTTCATTTMSNSGLAMHARLAPVEDFVNANPYVVNISTRLEKQLERRQLGGLPAGRLIFNIEDLNADSIKWPHGQDLHLLPWFKPLVRTQVLWQRYAVRQLCGRGMRCSSGRIRCSCHSGWNARGRNAY